MKNEFILTSEQQAFIDTALSGKNVLVDACIGSGKTTAIQYLCNQIQNDKQVLYLTYNRLLKLDAKQKITNPNVCVQNYHGYAYEQLRKKKLNVARDDLLREFNNRSLHLPLIDILIIDEYQDIDSQIARMLKYIKQYYPDMQIIMVGDMCQKIYDNSFLNVTQFAEEFLGNYTNLEFTTCFRLSSGWASELGQTWNKQINGVNTNCTVNYMSEDEVAEYLLTQDSKDILCLGPQSRPNSYGAMLNKLETLCPEKFNKHTVYASIREKDTDIRPDNDNAIFTTYDSSKGLEKKILVLFDWTADYWNTRSNVPYQQYEILRNIFCVAASRGKEQIIIVKSEDQLEFETIRKPFACSVRSDRPYDISQIFQFAKAEELNNCFCCLKTRPLNTKYEHKIINIQRQDELIDLSPCIGIYQEAVYFKNYDIDKQIISVCTQHKITPEPLTGLSLFEKILYLTSIETGLQRYRTQTTKTLVTDKQWKELENRLNERLDKAEDVQRPCIIKCMDNRDHLLYSAVGFADVVKDNTVYELKFTSELSHANFLQCATYMVALNIPKGILWNTYTNEIHEITIPNKKRFLDALTALLTKKFHMQYRGPLWTDEDEVKQQEAMDRVNIATQYYIKEQQRMSTLIRNNQERLLQERRAAIDVSLKRANSEVFTGEAFAVIDTETTWSDPRRLRFGTKFLDTVFSLGVVIADANTFEIIRIAYYILTPENTERAMYAEVSEIAPDSITKKCTREECIADLRTILSSYRVRDIFAYNASFDFKHLPELMSYSWHDIMRKAAYKEFNPLLKSMASDIFHSTGRLKRGYGVEAMCRLFKNDEYFSETHCAVFDAMDELFIMKKLKFKINTYPLLNIV